MYIKSDMKPLPENFGQFHEVNGKSDQENQVNFYLKFFSICFLAASCSCSFLCLCTAEELPDASCPHYFCFR